MNVRRAVAAINMLYPHAHREYSRALFIVPVSAVVGQRYAVTVARGFRSFADFNVVERLNARRAGVIAQMRAFRAIRSDERLGRFAAANVFCTFINGQIWHRGEIIDREGDIVSVYAVDVGRQINVNIDQIHTIRPEWTFESSAAFRISVDVNAHPQFDPSWLQAMVLLIDEQVLTLPEERRFTFSVVAHANRRDNNPVPCTLMAENALMEPIDIRTLLAFVTSPNVDPNPHYLSAAQISTNHSPNPNLIELAGPSASLDSSASINMPASSDSNPQYLPSAVAPASSSLAVFLGAPLSPDSSASNNSQAPSDPTTPPNSPASGVQVAQEVIIISDSDSESRVEVSHEDRVTSGEHRDVAGPSSSLVSPAPQPVFPVSPQHSTKREFECLFCYSKFSTGLCSALSCGHIFHQDCIDAIFSSYRGSDGALRCPICGKILMRIIVTSTSLTLTRDDNNENADGRTMQFLDVYLS